MGIILWISVSIFFLSCGLGRSSQLSLADRTPRPESPASETEVVAPEAEGENFWQRAIAAAATAEDLAQRARDAAAWDRVAESWMEAINILQAVPPDSPQRVFTQRRLQGHLAQLEAAQQQAEQASARPVMPSLGSPILDEQIALYRSYVATVGVPDVLIVGSSRALQGLDPEALQAGLAAAGYGHLRAYNFGVNGATAQMVSFVLRRLLTPEELPQMVLWPGGSRSFNSSRFDRTFATLLASPGYAALNSDSEASPTRAIQPSLPISPINAYGFLPLKEQFSPAIYYRSFPRVSGRYDNDYSPFRLDGVQAVSFAAVVSFLKAQQIPLVFINLPLTDNYLDAIRLGYERQFQGFLQKQAQSEGLQVVDLLEQWQGQNQYFADPSHLNQYGAAAIARQLAASRSLPWPEPAAEAE
ncbi:hypothetical protein C7271_18360 [filamentous cyanobacterium CCP5]|nr:hypothetical protein C7271_18360 [filamentous cyanobacterium CCP5]